MVSKLATFRTDDETWDSFQAKAKRNGTNASALLQRFVRDYLDDKLDSRIDSHAAPDVDIQVIINEAIAPLVARLEALETNRSEAVAPTKKVEDSRLTELETEIKRLNNAIGIKDNEIEHHKKEISNKTHKINDLQIEIQDYHRDQLEKAGISLPPREETVLTLSGNFTQKDLDKAAKKGAKKQSNIAAPTVEKSLDNEGLSEAIAASAKPTKKKSKSKKALAEIDVEQAYELAKSRGYGGSIQSFKQDFSRQKEAFGQKYGLERWKKEEGHTKPYSYRDTL